MGWIIALGLAVAAFALLVLAFKAPRGGWEAIGAALMLGIAGFAWQARPAQPGAPKLAQEAKPKDAAALVAARQELAKQSGQMPNSWMVIADAFARNGQFGDAAGVVLGARVPIVLTSRADTAETRVASCAVAALIAHAKRKAAA